MNVGKNRIEVNPTIHAKTKTHKIVLDMCEVNLMGIDTKLSKKCSIAV